MTIDGGPSRPAAFLTVVAVAVCAVIGAVAAGVFYSVLAALVVLAVAALAAPLAYLSTRSIEIDRGLRRTAALLSGGSAAQNGSAPEAVHTAAGRLIASAAGARRGAEQLAAALNRMSDPVLVLDPSGRSAFANPALDALVGIRALGRPVDELFPATDLPRIHADAAAGESVTEPILMRRADGPRTWEVSAQPLPDWPNGDSGGVAGGGYSLLTFRDITDAARALQVRTDFVANASHELRTPIAAIRMALDTLTTIEDADAPMRERLMGMIAGQVARLDELARDMLDLSRLESEAEMQHDPLDLSDLASTLRTRFEGACRERRLTLEFEFAHAAPAVRTDRRLVELILGNLIENATKFAFEGTVVRITARTLPDAGSVNGSAAEAQTRAAHGAHGGIRLEVIDKGIGIPLEQQQRIFERFYQADPSRSGARRGSGLGLAIVKHAVRRLGGTIRVTSVWQQGTTMTIELPTVS